MAKAKAPPAETDGYAEDYIAIMRLMEARIRHLEGMLRDPDIVERTEGATEVGPGMLVTLRPLDDDDPEDETYLLALSAEERAKGVRTITLNSPLGSIAAPASCDRNAPIAS